MGAQGTDAQSCSRSRKRAFEEGPSTRRGARSPTLRVTPLCTPRQGTFVIPLLASSHRDPTQFKDPDCFNPTNFLDDKGEFQSNDAFMPFALGMRLEGEDRPGLSQVHGREEGEGLTVLLHPQESGCAWAQAWRARRSSSSLPPSCKGSTCSLWGARPISTSPRSALAWATCPQYSSSAWWPAEACPPPHTLNKSP